MGGEGQQVCWTIVQLGIDVGDPGEVTYATALSKFCHPSIIQLFNVQYLAGQKRPFLIGMVKFGTCPVFSLYPSSALE
jgi:hypothetical protein